MSPRTQSPAAIERSIAHTRAELGHTVEAIQQRLERRRLVEKGFDMFRDNFASSDAINRGVATIRANPVPFALFGIGAAWLIAGNVGAGSRPVEERIAAMRRRAATGPEDHALGHTGNPVVDRPEEQRSAAWVHQASDMTQAALRSVRDGGEAAFNRAGAYVGDGAGRAANGIGDTIKRHPLAVGAIGVMAGALLASLLPLTRREEEWIGGAREQLWQKAEDAGQQAVSLMRDAVGRQIGAADATRTELREASAINKG